MGERGNFQPGFVTMRGSCRPADETYTTGHVIQSPAYLSYKGIPARTPLVLRDGEITFPRGALDAAPATAVRLDLYVFGRRLTASELPVADNEDPSFDEHLRHILGVVSRDGRDDVSLYAGGAPNSAHGTTAGHGWYHSIFDTRDVYDRPPIYTHEQVENELGDGLLWVTALIRVRGGSLDVAAGAVFDISLTAQISAG